MDDEQRDKLLIEMGMDLKYLRSSHEKLEKTVYGDEQGRGGLCSRVTLLETFKSNILIIVAAITGTITFAGNWLLSFFPLGGH